MQTDRLWNPFSSQILCENIFLYFEPAALLGGGFIPPLLTTSTVATSPSRSLDRPQKGGRADKEMAGARLAEANA